MKLKIPNWLIFFILIIGIFFGLPYLGLFIGKYIILFMTIWVIMPVICTIVLFTKSYKKFRFKSFKYYNTSTIAFVIMMSLFIFPNFSNYSDKIDDYFRVKYGEVYNWSESVSRMNQELSELRPEFEDLKNIDTKDENGNDIFAKGHTTLSKTLFKLFEILLGILIFLIPIYTWKVNHRISEYFSTLEYHNKTGANTRS